MSRFLTWMIVAGIAAACGAVLVVVIESVFDPSPQSNEPEPLFAAVPRETFSDPQPASIKAARQQGEELYAPRSGVLTDVRCGVPWASGSVVASLDGDPIIAIHLPQPPWRDLQRGDRGSDVKALQSFLSSSEGGSAALAVDGIFDAATDAAMDDFRYRSGQTSGYSGVFAPLSSAFVWLPVAETDPVSCLVHVGQRVTAGEAFVSLPDRVLQYSVTASDASALRGDRVLVVGELRVRVHDGVVDDEADVQALSASEPVASASRASDEFEVPVTLELEPPLSGYAVPPSAIVGRGTDQCVVVKGGVVLDVDVVASTVGRSLVTGPSDAEIIVAVEPELALCPPSN